MSGLAEALRGLLADPYLADPINADRMAPARAALAAHDAAAPSLADALRAYVRAVEHAQRYVNPEEWETHIDWRKLASDAAAALADEGVES